MSIAPVTPAPADTAAVALLTAWLRADGKNARRPSVALQLAVVQYCTDRPGTPVPALDDMPAVRALVGTFRRYRVRSNDSDMYPWAVWDVVLNRSVNVCQSSRTAATVAREKNDNNV